MSQSRHREVWYSPHKIFISSGQLVITGGQLFDMIAVSLFLQTHASTTFLSCTTIVTQAYMKCPFMASRLKSDPNLSTEGNSLAKHSKMEETHSVDGGGGGGD